MVKQRMMYMAEQANKTEERMRAAQESRDHFAAEERKIMQEQFRQQQERDENARLEQQQNHQQQLAQMSAENARRAEQARQD